MADTTYTPPKVWTHDAENGGTWASINRPTAGAREQKDLPRGEHPFQLYSLGTPNGQKVTILFEELLAAGVSEAEYDACSSISAKARSSPPALSRSTPIPRFPPSSIARARRRSASSNRVRSCSTSPRSSACSCPRTARPGLSACPG